MKEPRPCRCQLFLLTYAMLLTFSSAAQDIDLRSVSSTYAIKDATIVQSPGKVINDGIVLLEDGVIKAVGKSVTIPAHAQIIEADSMYVYAGFINGLSHAGLPKPKEKTFDRGKIKDPANPPNELAGIQPEQMASNLLKPADESVSSLRKLGFTAAHSVPHGRMLPGKGTLILLHGSTADEMVLINETSMFSQLSGAPRRLYPNTVIGVMAKYRELYRQASQSKDYQIRYKSNASGMTKPEQSFVEEAFYPVLEKRIPVVFKAQSVLDIQRVLTLQSDLGFNLVLGEVKQGWDVIDKLKGSDAKVFLTLDFPKINEEKPDSVTIEEPKTKTDFELEKEHLEKRKQEMIEKHFLQASAFKEKGIIFGFSTLEVKPGDIKKNLNALLDFGMDESDVLAALTTHPAELLGVSNIMGTIDVGKMANLIISDRPYFQKESNLRYVFVNGNIHEYEAKPDKKKEKDTDKN
ncbi:MAG: amidohydrolase family protein [Bacteroidota bacterium]